MEAVFKNEFQDNTELTNELRRANEELAPKYRLHALQSDNPLYPIVLVLMQLKYVQEELIEITPPLYRDRTSVEWSCRSIKWIVTFTLHQS